jgi:hypothetical protein
MIDTHGRMVDVDDGGGMVRSADGALLFAVWRSRGVGNGKALVIVGHPPTVDADGAASVPAWVDEHIAPALARFAHHTIAVAFLDPRMVYRPRIAGSNVAADVAELARMARSAGVRRVVAAWGIHAGEAGDQVAAAMSARRIPLEAMGTTRSGIPLDPTRWRPGSMPRAWSA